MRPPETRGDRGRLHRLAFPGAIAYGYGLADRASVYRHAYALGLI
jgi:hypothetical protein